MFVLLTMLRCPYTYIHHIRFCARCLTADLMILSNENTNVFYLHHFSLTYMFHCWPQYWVSMLRWFSPTSIGEHCSEAVLFIDKTVSSSHNCQSLSVIDADLNNFHKILTQPLLLSWSSSLDSKWIQKTIWCTYYKHKLC